MKTASDSKEQREKDEKKRRLARERKARHRARQPEKKRIEERARAREAMARRRQEASEREKVKLRAKAREAMENYRNKLTPEERAENLARERARKAKKRQERLEMQLAIGTPVPKQSARKVVPDRVTSAPERSGLGLVEGTNSSEEELDAMICDVLLGDMFPSEGEQEASPPTVGGRVVFPPIEVTSDAAI
mmetsp:Transcript_3748/g.7872  ORF Transcript_3748/g.7872 Transcript_3748/m.7872 type:complete len:191 (-) Transcript_3748:177-749(-)|eukprot:CAMPEP_0172554812 /NCGR_PEP_ID=MMETSP1067-20121228/56562_1 /TAXON_ID=265564 ORGANISM="Thalassiosira punctigera, Strain Tpunct2005C2" /NCGR_SAMPLE_ID=MMETSP1067 /ASSEMBLY_ACC=CAM_ASM_000444 /LENGTH=190 /DNA_ID=CAMNT_0013343255 /DNA_START=99 /DNA_END=671 /DNA_ORIENTATION=-